MGSTLHILYRLLTDYMDRLPSKGRALLVLHLPVPMLSNWAILFASRVILYMGHTFSTTFGSLSIDFVLCIKFSRVSRVVDRPCCVGFLVLRGVEPEVSGGCPNMGRDVPLDVSESETVGYAERLPFPFICYLPVHIYRVCIRWVSPMPMFMGSCWDVLSRSQLEVPFIRRRIRYVISYHNKYHLKYFKTIVVDR